MQNIKVIADIVINHRGGVTGWYDFSTPGIRRHKLGLYAIIQTLVPLVKKGTGNDYDPVLQV
jgi:hypothetical protein